MAKPPESLLFSLAAPRPVQVRFGTILSDGFSYLFLLGLIVLALWGLRSFIGNEQALLKNGRTAQATVVSKKQGVNSQFHDSSIVYKLFYKYRVDGEVYTKSDTVDESHYNAAAVGSRFTLTYLPDDPQDTQTGVVTNNSARQAELLILVVVGASVLILIHAAVAVHKQVLKHAELLRNGVASHALVTERRYFPGSRWIRYRLECSISLGQQPSQLYTFTVTKNTYNDTQVGSSLALLYMANAPQICELYVNINDVVLCN